MHVFLVLVVKWTVGKKVKFQSVKVSFPEKLYFVTNWLRYDNGQLYLYPHKHVYKDSHVGLKEAQEIYKGINKKSKNVLEYALINALSFSEKVPLKKEYWEGLLVEHKAFDRVAEFLEIYSQPSLYKLLVTPIDSRENTFSAQAPFLKSVGYDDLEIFMKHSDWYVDPLADSCALYSIGETKSINIFTNEIVTKDLKVTSEKVYLGEN